MSFFKWMLMCMFLTLPHVSIAINAPYPTSQIITGMSWDFSTLANLRKANGSDLWPLAWAADGNLYGAWGDGGGFDGNSNSTGRVSLGFAQITGTPAAGNPSSYAGWNVWARAPAYAQHLATFGGKVDDLVSVNGILYGHGGLWTKTNCACADPTLKSGDNPTQRTLIWSADLGKTWTIAPWTIPISLGATLQFGQDYRGAWDPSHVYMYYQRKTNVDPTHVYLRRVALADLKADPDTSGRYEYWVGPDTTTTPSWSTVEANAVPVFEDSNIPLGSHAGGSVVYVAGLGRYLLTAFHGDGAGQLGFFEAPHPWGPWATIAYYSDWGGLNEAAGEGNGLSFPSKWISQDGKSMWAAFSALNAFDSFNVAKVTLTTNSALPRITAPAEGSVMTPGETVIAQGAGSGLSWSVDVLNDGQPAIATGAGTSIRFVVPSNAQSSETIRITLNGQLGTVYRDYSIAASSGMPSVAVTHVSTGKTYSVTSAQLGTLIYIDRTYTLNGLSPALTGARLIQTANDDKFQTASDYLQFTVDRPATVYVCYSKSGTVLPAWLTNGSWTLTSETCDPDDNGSPTRAVYRRSVGAGPVTLGGNREPPAQGIGNYSNYIVLVAR